MDIVEVGDNWKTFYWPSQIPNHHKQGENLKII